MTRKQVREKIADYIKGVRIATKVDNNDVAFFIRYPISSEGMADQILALDGIRVEAENQDVPTHYGFDYLNPNTFKATLLKPDSKGCVWVKCLPKEDK